MGTRKIAIIGAGLAGCSVAYELSKIGDFDITIFDKNCQIADDASGNFAGILAPYLTSDNNYSDQFHTLGYKLLLGFIDEYKDNLEICNKGMLQILNDEKEQGRHTKIFRIRDIPKDLASLLDRQQTFKLLNKELNVPAAVYYPNALSLVPKSICQLWLKLSNAKLILDTELVDIKKLDSNGWLLEFDNFNERFDIVIFTGGYELFKKISYLQKIPVYPSQGQLTVINKTFDIKDTVIGKGYIIPNYKDNLQVIGATFRENNDTTGEIRDSDNEYNLFQIKQMLPGLSKADINIVDSRVATRCVTSDHLPLVGRLVDFDKFEQDFYKPLSKGYPKSKMPQVEYENGLYLSSGFGSKGLCSSLLAAKIITCQIINQPDIVSEKLLEALSPQRFWVRSFKKKL
ncbi:tRNA U-34 5-methylaminomethyl-2-thiouridine biosynthesis protein MnmC [Allofrancisella inopinata]|uniref:FAD-dependent oxidoreductase n=1 Tax=Allofrancisella inopinata TaxID=1085647 RepID=A0AAE6YIG6_9GAMM|nr:FAD-dependent 5-carboxymethylaminomethyl-2-thiouridine(34) oxidoreductase MnmC [Allofrancisella inopinata]QIV96116.1 FAD-dependent oxidoreductase [Allofrancisella inopinata]TDT66987.1 tRNA U-34 5-methylaminomethyl-2-thiouridine biosynthesis protein MnmC [Allofrancisella inopinata]